MVSVSERIHAYFPALLKRAGKWCKDPQDRYDLAVDTMVYSLERANKFRADGGFYNWLMWNMRAVMSNRRYGQVVDVEFVDTTVAWPNQEHAVDVKRVAQRKDGDILIMLAAGYTLEYVAIKRGLTKQAVSQRAKRARELWAQEQIS